jgi:hypothetical protein
VTTGCGNANHQQRGSLNYIPHLNKAGRRYMMEAPASKAKGVQVLKKVKHTLDCLLLHLQENPLLCMRQDAQPTPCGKEEKGR